MPTNPLILAFPDYAAQAERLADALGWPCAPVELHRFPDGESRVRLPAELPPRVVLCRSLDHPNHKLVELLLAAATARDAGVRHLTLVAPYLCYMRQDMAFAPGEAVSQRVVGRFLGGLFDALLTVDPHLHRIARLDEAVTAATALSLCAAPLAARFLRALGGKPLLLGPDSESEQWVREVARGADLDYVVARKQRHGDRQVSIELPPAVYQGRPVVLVDDIASTCHTLENVTRQLLAAGASAVDCLVTHALCDGSGAERLRAAGVGGLWSSDSITHPSNAFSLTPLLAPALAGLAEAPTS